MSLLYPACGRAGPLRESFPLAPLLHPEARARVERPRPQQDADVDTERVVTLLHGEDPAYYFNRFALEPRRWLEDAQACERLLERERLQQQPALKEEQQWRDWWTHPQQRLLARYLRFECTQWGNADASPALLDALLRQITEAAEAMHCDWMALFYNLRAALGVCDEMNRAKLCAFYH